MLTNYGLPKIHIVGFLLRIIQRMMSALGSFIYNVAKFLHNILNNSIPKPYSYIKDNWSFVTKINGVNIQPDELLVSLDDISLTFTNIPKELVLDGIEKRRNYISQATALNLPQFLHY